MSRGIYDAENDVLIPTAGLEDSSVPTFTMAQWEALTDDQKAEYHNKLFIISDDFSGMTVDDNLSLTSGHPVENRIITSALVNVDTQIQTLTDNVSTNATNIANVSQKVSNSNDAYSATKAYSVGDLCIYNNTLYRCITACSAAAWSVNSSCFEADTLVHAVGSALKTIDTSNVIQSTITQQANMTYTATQDCAVVYTLVAYPTQANVNTQRNVLLNGEIIDGIGAQVTTAGAVVSRKVGNIIVKKGDIVTIQSGGGFYSAYTVYGLK